jgi:hypothetical protein
VERLVLKIPFHDSIIDNHSYKCIQEEGEVPPVQLSPVLPRRSNIRALPALSPSRHRHEPLAVHQYTSGNKRRDKQTKAIIHHCSNIVTVQVSPKLEGC